MNDDVRLHCPDCGLDMPLSPQRCPHCSQLMTVRRSGGPRGSSMSPVVLILLLFFLLGPFGFGMLWRNERIELPWKMALTVIVSIWTVLALWWAYAAMNQALDAVMGSGGGKTLDGLMNF